jgi:hypothetical protein
VGIQQDVKVSTFFSVKSFKPEYWSAAFGRMKNGKIKNVPGRKKSAKKAAATQILSQADDIILPTAEGARPPKRKAAVLAEGSEVRRSKRHRTDPQKSNSPESEDGAGGGTPNGDSEHRRTRSNATYYTAST